MQAVRLSKYNQRQRTRHVCFKSNDSLYYAYSFTRLYLHYLQFLFAKMGHTRTKTCKYERAAQGQAASFVWSPDIFVSHIIDPNCRDCQWALILIITVLSVLRFDDFKLFHSLIIIIDEQAALGWTPLHNQWDIFKILMLQRIIDLSLPFAYLILVFNSPISFVHHALVADRPWLIWCEISIFSRNLT